MPTISARSSRTLLARCLALWLLIGTATSAPALRLAYQPVALDWSAHEVDRATQGNGKAILTRASQQGLLGCRRHCKRLQRVYARLLVQARQQSAHAHDLPWRLQVVRLPDVEALALPGGQLIVSEPFIDRHAASDEALAFVLAHEMAHCILEHERQALSFARMLLPRQVPRSVRDMYTELDFNFGLLKAMEPVLQQGEFEADELGLQLAARAGYAPRAQLRFLADQAALPPSRAPLVATHPPEAERLDRLRRQLPLAERLFVRR